jgi:hypothetical protein
MMRLPPYLPAAYPYPAIELKGKNMAENEGGDSLKTFIGRVRLTWGPLSSELVAGCRRYRKSF